MSRLIQADCTNLQSLDLSCSDLAGQGMMQLAVGQCPLLNKLDTGHMQKLYTLTRLIDASFARGSWPQLTYLSLANNQMGNACTAELVNANWPKLQTLDLHNDETSDCGCDCLDLGNWPDLQSLCIEEPERERPRCTYKRRSW